MLWPHILLIFCQLLLSLWHFLVKNVTNSDVNVILFTLVRMSLGTLLLYLNCKSQGLRIHVSKPDYMIFFFLGLCIAVGVCGSIFALMYVSAQKYGLMQPSVPIFGTIISVCFGIERLNFLKIAGVLSAVAGAVLMELVGSSDMFVSEEDMMSDELFGLGIAVAVCICLASVIVVQKPLLSKYNPAVLCTVFYGIGTFVSLSLYVLLVSLSMTKMIEPIVSFQYTDLYFEFNSTIYCCLLYGAVFVTLVCYNIISYVSGLIAPSIVTIYSTALPVWTAMISFFVFNKSLSFSESIGGGLIALGLILSVRGGVVDKQSQTDLSSLPRTRIDNKWGNFEKFKN
jgi:drug/metabolite transporter (DMT)-like permease